MKAVLVRLVLAVVLGAVALGAVARDASAFVTNCSNHPGVHGIWRHNNHAPNGSLRAQAIANAYAQWRAVVPSNRGIVEAGVFCCTHNLSEDPSQISFAPEGSLFLPVGVGGITWVRQNGCSITGVDILLSTNVSYWPPNDSTPTGLPSLGFQDPGRSFIVHEFGHALGLAIPQNHPTTFAIMRAGGPFVTFGAMPFASEAAALAPDDAAGARFLYGNIGTPRNVASTQTKLFQGSIRRVWEDPNAANDVLNVCSGSPVNIPSHTANTGTSSSFMNHKIYMQPYGAGNPWDAFHPANTQIAQAVDAFHNLGTTNLITHSARVPCNMPVGLYHVMHFADSTNRLAEYNEGDNTSIYPITLAVQGCSHTSCIWQ